MSLTSWRANRLKQDATSDELHKIAAFYCAGVDAQIKEQRLKALQEYLITSFKIGDMHAVRDAAVDIEVLLARR